MVDRGPRPSVLIVGYGAIGRRHARVVRALFPGADLRCVTRGGQIAAAADGLQIEESLPAALKMPPDFAIVANAASGHVQAAMELLEAGIPGLIEKPLAQSAVEALSLVERGDSNSVMRVGYCLRHDPSLRAVRSALAEGRIGRPLMVQAWVGQHLPDWRPGFDHRDSVSAQRSLGGGALLELSHELDYLCWLFGPVARLSAELVEECGLDLDVETGAALLIRFASGVIASVHLDMRDRAPRRGVRIVGETGSLVWDGRAHRAVHALSTEENEVLCCWTPADGDELYVRQLEAFLADARDRGARCATLQEAWSVVSLIDEARDARSGLRLGNRS